MLAPLSDLLLIIGRIVTILPLLLMVTLFMGKRAIGELPVFDFLVIITLASVVGADIADPNIQHIPTTIAIIAIGVLQKIVSHLKLANRTIGKLLTFEPTVVIYQGAFLPKNLKKIGYSIDNILQMLRDKEVFDVSDVELALVEANGSLSVLKKAEKTTLTRKDLQLKNTDTSISYPIIIEGKVVTSMLNTRNLNEQWLETELKKWDITKTKEVFFASVNSNNQLHISLYDDQYLDVPPMEH
ncbi:DUF421 domain-containing protein [Gracilibacillus caseinilyticus]|uniref:DUF421 domain-containing protein n=1 Tax=Gracilibacillus caseinilyticus TaxID=2932256 RepID=A0ABY4F185_9BACI|nr:DUF421 domain-containing protein [Gracilibacillus caseinilyticus]UOQ49932.1 DUF421 domain-containing protein [Gracilibacillus caseinilyticus]